MDDLTESLAEDIDWKALYEQLCDENEHLRLRIVSLRDSRLADVAYWWQEALDWLREPYNQTLLLLVVMPLLLTLVRELFAIWRHRRNKS